MIIALLTDFGTKDYFVGAMKGVILSVNQKANIIDITHEILPENIRQAAFSLRACYREFPKKNNNLVTNLKKEDLPEDFAVEINKKRIEKLQNYFAESEKDEIFMIFGSSGFLEIAAFQNSAAKILETKIGGKIKSLKNS